MVLVGVDRLHAGSVKIGWLAVADCIFSPYLRCAESYHDMLNSRLLLRFPRFRRDYTNEHLQWKGTRKRFCWPLLPQARGEGSVIAIVPWNGDIGSRPWRAVKRLVPPLPHVR